MFLDDVPINSSAVLVGALVYFILGAIWYAPKIFGHRWMRHDRIVLGEPPSPSFFQRVGSYVGELLLSFIIAYVLALFIQISQAEQIVEGITVALWAWIGFIATTHFSAVLWGRKTVKSFFIHAGFMLVGFIAMSAAMMSVGI